MEVEIYITKAYSIVLLIPLSRRKSVLKFTVLLFKVYNQIVEESDQNQS